MRLRRRYVPLAAALGLATAVLPAIASSETSPTIEAVNEPGGGIYLEEHHHWAPTHVSVAAGGVVTLSNPTAVNHGVEWVSAAKPTCEEGPGKVPVGTSELAAAKNWSGACTFTQPGTYVFYCTVHHAEMTGTITVSPNGTTTATQTNGTTGTSGTTTTPVAESPSSSPLLGGPSIRPNQRGTTVRGSLDISQTGAGDRLEVDLLASRASLAKAKQTARILVGRFVRSKVSAGQQSFSVKLNAKARRSLNRHHRLALVVKIVLTPFYGEPTTLSRSAIEHG